MINERQLTTVEQISEARAATGRLFTSLLPESDIYIEVAKAYVILRNLEVAKTHGERPITLEDLGVWS